VQTAKVGVTKRGLERALGQGFLFLQFCDIENLVKISHKIAKLVRFTLKPKNSQTFPNFLVKKATKFARKKPLRLGGQPRVFLRN
jgi:hypothetical protein